MIKLFFLLSLLTSGFTLQAVNYSGTYSYSKGMNLAGGIIYLTHFKEDSAFFILQAVSGMPDFNTTELKGFVKIENDMGLYQGLDSSSITFHFTTNACVVSENAFCKFDFSTNGKYKRIATKLKRGNNLLPSFADKVGMVKNDSTYCYAVPVQTTTPQMVLSKNEIIQITDEFNGFYLVEVKNKKNDILWVSKKNIRLEKK